MPKKQEIKKQQNNLVLFLHRTRSTRTEKGKVFIRFFFSFSRILGRKIETFEVTEVQVGTAAKYFPMEQNDLRFSIKLDPYS